MKKLRKQLTKQPLQTQQNKTFQQPAYFDVAAKSPGDRPGVPPREPLIEAGLLTGRNLEELARGASINLAKQGPLLLSAHSGNKIRYFHCGEYGETTRRPHYHALIFGYRPEDGILWSEKGGNRLFLSPRLSSIWGHGNVWYGEVTFESAAYVARYVTKKINGDMAQKHYETIDRETGEIVQLVPEYATMSRRPGIGAEWIAKHGEYTYTHDHVIIRGKPAKPPRFYDTTFEKQRPDLVHAAKVKRAQKSRAAHAPENLDPEIKVDQRRRASEAITKARQIGRKGDFQ